MAHLFRKKPAHKGESTSQNQVMSVLVNERQFIAGLYWKPISSMRGYMGEARAIGKKHGWDVVAIRKGERIQAGFVARNSGVVKGMYSLAASLAGILGKTWIGAFEIGDGRYAVVAVRDGSIIPGFDVIVDGDKALETVKQGYNLFNQGSAAEVYVPASFNFGGKELRLEDLLQPKVLKGQYRLRPLEFPVGRFFLIIALLCVGFVAWTEYQNHRRAEEQRVLMEQARIKAAELAALNTRAKAAQQVKALEHPWAKLPGAEDMANRCVKEIHSLPLSLGGWLVERTKCEEGKMTAEFHRSGGTVHDFKEAVGDDFDGAPIITDNGEKATVTRVIADLLVAGDDPLQDADDVETRMISRFQSLGMRYDLVEKQVSVPVPPSVPGQPPVIQPRPTWRYFLFRYDGASNPTAVMKGMGSLNGIRLTSIKAQIGSDGLITWLVSGDLYASK